DPPEAPRFPLLPGPGLPHPADPPGSRGWIPDPAAFPGGDVTAKNIWLAENVLEILTEQRYGRERGEPSQTRNSQIPPRSPQIPPGLRSWPGSGPASRERFLPEPWGRFFLWERRLPERFPVFGRLLLRLGISSRACGIHRIPKRRIPSLGLCPAGGCEGLGWIWDCQGGFGVAGSGFGVVGSGFGVPRMDLGIPGWIWGFPDQIWGSQIRFGVAGSGFGGSQDGSHKLFPSLDAAIPGKWGFGVFPPLRSPSNPSSVIPKKLSLGAFSDPIPVPCRCPGVLQLLQSRTSRKFLACRLTPDMETKLLFMTSRVRFGQQKRYQDWFQRQYLSTADSQSLRCDLIRYICGVVHPSNEVLSSDILPRWAIIGWLLTTCTGSRGSRGSSGDLGGLTPFPPPEPAILVMHHSMKPHPAITATLLDFMCRIIPNFYPPLEAHVRQGVFNSLTHIVEKRVLAHLAPLFDNPKLDKELRAMLREKFPEFCSSPSPPMEVKIEEPVPMEMENHLEKDDGCYDNAEAAFSDDEEELNSKGKKREFRFHPIKESIVEEPVDITPFLEQLDESLKDKVLQLQKGRWGPSRPHGSPRAAGEGIPAGKGLGKELPAPAPQTLAQPGDSVQFLASSACFSRCNSSQSGIRADSGMGLYESFAQATQLGELHTCLMMDMKACQEDDVRLLCFLTPSIYTEFPDETLRSGELLNMIVAVIDSFQLQELVCHVMMGNLVMFRKDSVLNILSECRDRDRSSPVQRGSLELPQVSPGVPRCPQVSPGVPRCPQGRVSRWPAVARPSEEMVKMVLSRPCHPEDQFTTSILRHWGLRHDDLLGEHIKALLIKNNSLPRKRQRSGTPTPILGIPSQLGLLTLILGTLTPILGIPSHRGLGMPTPFLQALQHVQASCDEAHKMKFSDLFSLAEEYEDSSSKPPKSRRKATALASPRSRKSAAQPPNNEEESASSSASEEEDTKPKPAKRKRKGSSAVGSDSD
ncbi:integrator complex subunit 3, partial [Parus major]|uniref:integrator complex subunit 3 n=1 Tax=Parus major TaxID=9157 RepID=UPI001444558C